MSWRPRSISGQLMALWLLAILLAHLLAVLAVNWWRADNATVHPLSVRTIETRIVSAYRAAARSTDPATLLEDISLPESRFALADEPPEPPAAMDAQEGELARSLRARLDLPSSLPLTVHLAQVDTRLAALDVERLPGWLSKMFSGHVAWALDVDVGYPDGTWLHSRHWPTMMPAHWNRVLTFSLLVGTLPTTLIAILFGRRIMRPLRMLTEASRRVSRGETVMLPEPAGPDGVREITQAFNDMQRSLNRFVGGRTQMIAAIGHDLRTPLTSLRIRAELIDDDELREAMIRTLDEMSVIVEETLRFARDDVQHEPTQAVPLAGLVGEVVDGQRIHARDVDLRCRVDAGLTYRCRPVHLKRALSNLIENAARYGPVRVDVSADAAAHALRIDIDDDGPGIEPDRLEQVFEPFARLDAARCRDGHSGGGGSGVGLGLGLAIARSCVRAHGGDVTLANRVEGGLRATVELPV
ncbi:MAG: ATP-binding protein [Burkholderiaceae bacterium]